MDKADKLDTGPATFFLSLKTKRKRLENETETKRKRNENALKRPFLTRFKRVLCNEIRRLLIDQ